MSVPTYVIRGGLAGRERLRVIGRVMWPTTSALLQRVGLGDGAHCLDIGCGGGDVSTALAAMVPNGRVVGVDLDEVKVAMAQAEAAEAGLGNVEYRVENVMDAPRADERFDLVYLRFLLTHLADPAAALANVVGLLAPGGVLVAEDVDFSGSFCYPPSEAFRRSVQWYTAAVQGRGADPNIGPRLPSLLTGAGLADVEMNVVQPAGTTGEVKLLSPITLEAIADAVLAAGLATTAEVERTVDELYEFARTDGTVMSVPRVVQAWGRATTTP